MGKREETKEKKRFRVKENSEQNEGAKIADIDKLRKKRSRNAMLKRTLIVAVVILAAVAVIVGIETAGTRNISIIISDIAAGFTGGDGFPIEIDGSTVRDAEIVGGALSLLTDTGILAYNKSGGEIKNELHEYGSAAWEIAGNRIFVYDIGGLGLRLDSKSTNAFKKKYDEKIITADYSKSGRFAVITETSRRLCELKVYSKDETEIFKWGSSDNYATALSLSQNGKFVAVAAVNIEGAELSSNIIAFSVADGKELFRYSISDRLVLSMEYLDDGRISLVTDSAAITVGKGGNASVEYSYGNRILQNWSRSDNGRLALTFEDEIVILGPDTVKLFSQTGTQALLGNVIHSDFYKDTLFLSSSNGIYKLNADKFTQIISDEKLGGEGLKIAVSGNYIYCILQDKIERVEN